MKDTRARVVEIFNSLIASAPEGSFPFPIRLVVDEAAALQGRSPEGRGQAAATLDSNLHGVVYIAPKLLDAVSAGTAGVERCTGVLAHELGHVALLMSGNAGNGWNEDHSERDADAAALALFGVQVRYDADDVQTSGPGVSPRPARLDRRNNPGTSKALC